jgi:hypothetical protein
MREGRGDVRNAIQRVPGSIYTKATTETSSRNYSVDQEEVSDMKSNVAVTRSQ